jgi:hypothetical protein
MKNQIFTTVLLLGASVCFAQEAKEGANQNPAVNTELNSGYMLPEVLIAEEVQVSSLADDENAERADEFSELNMRLYAVRLEKEIAKNESIISSVKEKLKAERGKAAIKRWKELTVLEIQNEELKKNLKEYLHYGQGSWKLFQEEINEDLRPLREDLAQLQQEVQ